MSKDNTLDERIEAAIFQGFAVRDLDETGQDQELDFNRSIKAIKSLIAEERRKAKVEELKFMKTGDKTVTQYAEGGEIITYVFSAQEINDRLSRLEQEDE
jgi:hypothetical protein